MNSPEEFFVVYVVEDDESVLKSLCALLGSHGIDTVACKSAEEFLKRHDPAQKTCLLLDLRLPGMSGMELQAHLADSGANVAIIVVTAHGDIPVAVQAMRAGAIDFIEKPAKAEHLLDAVRSAGALLYNRAPADVPKSVVAERVSKLTEREKEVLQRLLEGKLNKEIAAELDISQRTVEVHRARIREKLRARGIADLIRMLG